MITGIGFFPVFKISSVKFRGSTKLLMLFAHLLLHACECWPFSAAVTASNILGRLSTSFMNVLMEMLDHSSMRIFM